MKPQTLAFSLVHEILVVVHTEEDPNDPEWAEWIEANHEVDRAGTHRGTLVVSHGGSPNGLQRRGIGGLSKPMRDRPVAIMMDSRVASLMVNAIGFLGQNIRAFRLSDWDSMCGYLAITAAEDAAVRETVRKHRDELGIR